MSFNETIPLLAADDWWQIAVGLVFFVLYGISQLLGAREEAQKKKARPPRPKPQPPQAPQPGAPAGPPNQADPLRAEVEEFLRRAQGKPAQQQQLAQPKPARPQRQRAAQQQPLGSRPIESRPIEGAQREATSRPSQPARPPQPAEPPARRRPKPQPLQPAQPAQHAQPAQPVDLRRESVVEHVARHVNTRDIKEHTSHLGEEVALADDHLEAHLEEAFSGQLGSLQHRKQEAVEQGPSIAEEIRNLISQPTGMRQMIVANEILRRPEDRW
ncbi:MAG: hypothetical protein IH831_04680 [Planctomycetes bacterium]|nr:hypothetical protein [Planctomycetota bacterium]